MIEGNLSNSNSLVVCPASLILHWEKEIQKFMNPNILTPIRYNKQIINDIIHPKSPQTVNTVVIISYDVLRKDQQLLSQYIWSNIILDEAHLIRNPKTLTSQAIFSLKSEFRILLTGTPIQNQIEDLWSIMNFLLPEYLGTLPLPLFSTTTSFLYHYLYSLPLPLFSTTTSILYHYHSQAPKFNYSINYLT